MACDVVSLARVSSCVDRHLLGSALPALLLVFFVHSLELIMATKRPYWYDSVDTTQDVLMEPDVKRSLMVLFNCALNESQRRNLHAGVGKNVVEALSLDSMAWPGFLRETVFNSSRELAVILSAGHTTEERSFDVLVCQLVVCNVDNKWQNRGLHPCGQVKCGALAGLHRSFVKILCTDVSATILEIPPLFGTLAVYNLSGLGDHTSDVLNGLFKRPSRWRELSSSV